MELGGRYFQYNCTKINSKNLTYFFSYFKTSWPRKDKMFFHIIGGKKWLKSQINTKMLKLSFCRELKLEI